MIIFFKKRHWDALGSIFSVCFFVVAVNFWAYQSPARIDLTSGHVYSPDDVTLEVLGKLTKPITVIFFYDVRSRAMQDARYLLEYYQSISPLINVKVHDPVLEPAIAERYQVKFAGATIFESGLRTVRIEQTDEVQFLNAIIRVSSEAAGVVCFTDGHIESNPFSLQSHDHIENQTHGHDHSIGGRPLVLHERHGMGMAKNALETIGYTVEQRLLLGGPSALAGCSIVVVASPQVAFSSRESKQLEKYTNNGGHVFLLLEPFINSGLEDLLQVYGLSISTKRIVDPKSYYWTDVGTPAVSNYERHRVTRSLPLSFFPGVAEIKPHSNGIPDDVIIVPLINTSEDSITEGDDTSQSRRRTIMVLVSKDNSRGRLIVAGDGDFSTNSFYGALGNGQLFLNGVSELMGNQNLINVVPRSYAAGVVRLSNSELTSIFILTIFITPLVLILVGVWVWLGRR